MIFGENIVRGVPAVHYDDQPSSWLDIFSTARRSQAAADNINSRFVVMEEAYDEWIDRIRTATGVTLQNPRRPQRMPLAMSLMAMFGGGQDVLDGDFQRQVDELAARFPDRAETLRGPSSITEQAHRIVQGREQAADDAYQRGGAFAMIPRFAGSFVGSLQDPVNLAAMLVGPMGRVGVGSGQVLWMGVRQGAANMAVEAGSQPFVQSWRREAGLEAGLGHALTSIGMAGLFGFGVDAGIRGASRTIRRGRGHVPLVDDAGGVVGWTPFARDLDAAAAALEAAAHRMPPGVVRSAAEGDVDAGWRLAHATGTNTDPAMRGARTAAEIERATAETLPVHVEETDGFERLLQAARAAVDGDEPPPRGADPVPPARPDAPAPEPGSPHALLLEGRVPSAVEAARLLRANPELLTAALPLSSHLTAQARNLARLSDEAFAAVEAGTLRANHAAIVGQLVEDRALHGEIARAIGEAQPRNVREVRAIISDVLQAPRGQHHDVQRVVLGGERLDAGLLGNRARVMDQAVKLLETDARVFRAVSKEASRLEPVGANRVDIDANVDRQLQSATVAAAIERLAAAPGPVQRWLTEAAREVAEGRKPKAAAQDVADRVAAAIERDGLESLIERPEPLLHTGRGIDEPAGPAAQAQVEALETQLARRLETAQRELAEDSVDKWVAWSRANGRAVPTLTPEERRAAVKSIQGGAAVADAVEAALVKAEERIAAGAKEPARDAFNDASAMRGLDTAVRLGRTWVLKQSHVDDIHAALDPMRHLVPSDVTVATLARVEPAGNGNVRMFFATNDGGEFDLVGPWRDFRGASASFLPSVPGLGRALVFWRATFGEEFIPALRGELWHELVHVYWSAADAATRARLVGHAKKLQILDMPVSAFAHLVDDEATAALNIPDSILSGYARRYAKYSQSEALLEEEHVAHMVQLISHGVLAPSEIAPVKPYLDRLFGGQLAVMQLRPANDDMVPRFAFAGRRAEGADLRALERAQEMDGRGADAVAIWRETGWFRGADGEWRFEIDDAAAKLHDQARDVVLNRNGAPVQVEMRADEALDHPTLFEAYPFLGELRVSVRRRREQQGGRYVPEHSRIDVVAESASRGRGILLEELQHAIQDIEQFAGGGNPHQMRLLTERAVADIDAEGARVVEQLGAVGWMDRLTGEKGRLEARLAELKGLRQQWAEADYFQMYRSLAGEVEARNTRTRSEMTAAGRRELAPWFTEDTPRNAQVVLRDNRAPRHAEEDWDSFQVADFLTGQAAWAEKAGKRGGRAPDPSQIERQAAKMAKQAATLERRLIGAGKTAAEIATEISAKFGAPVTADQVAKRMVWWNLDYLIKSRPQYPRELRDEMVKMYRAGVPLAEIGAHATRTMGREVLPHHVRMLLDRAGVGADRSPLKRVDLQAAAQSAATREPKARAWRKEWPPDAVAVLASDEIKGLSWAEVADLLRARTGNEYSVGTIKVKAHRLKKALAEEQRLAEAKGVVEVCKP